MNGKEKQKNIKLQNQKVGHIHIAVMIAANFLHPFFLRESVAFIQLAPPKGCLWGAQSLCPSVRCLLLCKQRPLQVHPKLSSPTHPIRTPHQSPLVASVSVVSSAPHPALHPQVSKSSPGPKEVSQQLTQQIILQFADGWNWGNDRYVVCYVKTQGMTCVSSMIVFISWCRL